MPGKSNKKDRELKRDAEVWHGADEAEKWRIFISAPISGRQ